MTRTPHDALFKTTYKIKSEVIAHLKFFNPEIAKNLDFETLEHDDTSYVSDTLDEFFSDVAYTCMWKSKTPVKITLLFEHKSYYDKNLPIQILIYIAQVWARQLKSREAPTVVLPIIFYHGKEKFQLRKIEDAFGEIDENLKKFLPKFDFLLTDLNEVTNDRLMHLQNHILISTLFVFKHQGDWDYVLKNLDFLLQFENYDYEQYIKDAFFMALITYLCIRFEAKGYDWEKLKKRIPPKLNNLTMTIERYLREQGMEEGMEKGALEKATLIVRNLIKEFPEFSDAKIARMAVVSDKLVAEIRTKIESEKSAESNSDNTHSESADNLDTKTELSIKKMLKQFPKITDTEIAKFWEVEQTIVKKLRAGLNSEKKKK